MIILIAEDDDAHFNLMRLHVLKSHPSCTIHRAKTVTEAMNLFFKYGDVLCAVIVDACLNSRREIDTDEFVREINRSGFSGPIITASGLEHFNDQLFSAGATHRAIKWHAGKLAAELLNP